MKNAICPQGLNLKSGNQMGNMFCMVISSSGEPEAVEFNDYADRSLHPSNPNMVRRYTDGQGQQRIRWESTPCITGIPSKVLGFGLTLGLESIFHHGHVAILMDKGNRR